MLSRAKNQSVGHIFSAASTPLSPLASGTAANHLQLAMITFKCLVSLSGAVLPGWRLNPRFINRLQVAAAVGRQRDTRRAYEDYDRLVRLCCTGPATWNSLPVELRTSSLSPETFAERLKSHPLALLYFNKFISQHTITNIT